MARITPMNGETIGLNNDSTIALKNTATTATINNTTATPTNDATIAAMIDATSTLLNVATETPISAATIMPEESLNNVAHPVGESTLQETQQILPDEGITDSSNSQFSLQKLDPIEPELHTNPLVKAPAHLSDPVDIDHHHDHHMSNHDYVDLESPQALAVKGENTASKGPIL